MKNVKNQEFLESQLKAGRTFKATAILMVDGNPISKTFTAMASKLLKKMGESTDVSEPIHDLIKGFVAANNQTGWDVQVKAQVLTESGVIVANAEYIIVTGD